MQHARTVVVLVAILTALMVACGRTEIVVITATPSPSPTPTQTYSQWLGQQVSVTICSDPEATVPDYRNENRNPPYSADFYCRRPDGAAPTPEPDPVATWVAAAVAANPTPTRRPTTTLRPTRVPISTPTPTPLPTRTRAWPTPTPQIPVFPPALTPRTPNNRTHEPEQDRTQDAHEFINYSGWCYRGNETRSRLLTMPWILDGVTQIEYDSLSTIFGFNCANWPDGELDEEGWEALLEMAEDWQQTIGQEEVAPTPIRRPTATPKPQLQTSETYHDSTVIEAGWSADVFIWPEADPGYLNFEFSSTHDIRMHQALDVGFQIHTASDKLAFRTPPITAYRGAVPSQKGEYYYWRFSNRHSQFASKYVKVSVFWSSQPVRGYPVIPYYGAEAGSEACRQAEEDLARHRAQRAERDEAVVSGIFRAAVNYFNPAGLGVIGTIGALMPAISSIFSNDEAGMDTAAAATIAWGCGIE